MTRENMMIDCRYLGAMMFLFLFTSCSNSRQKHEEIDEGGAELRHSPQVKIDYPFVTKMKYYYFVGKDTIHIYLHQDGRSSTDPAMVHAGDLENDISSGNYRMLGYVNACFYIGSRNNFAALEKTLDLLRKYNLRLFFISVRDQSRKRNDARVKLYNLSQDNQFKVKRNYLEVGNKSVLYKEKELQVEGLAKQLANVKEKEVILKVAPDVSIQRFVTVVSTLNNLAFRVFMEAPKSLSVQSGAPKKN